MTLVTILALAMGCTKDQCKEPDFDPSGLFNLGVQAEQTYETEYRDGTFESSGGVVVDSSTVGITNTVAVTYSKRTKTVSVDGTDIQLANYGGGACDSGEVTDTAGTVVYPAWIGTAYLSSSPAGTLSNSLGMDLGGFDCSLSQTVSIKANYSPTGDDVSFDVAQTLTLDDSAACQAALESAKQQIFATQSIPAFFFNWAASNGIEFTSLENLESMTVRYRLTGTKISEETATAGADTGANASATSSFARSAARALRKAFMVSEKALGSGSDAILNSAR